MTGIRKRSNSPRVDQGSLDTKVPRPGSPYYGGLTGNPKEALRSATYSKEGSNRQTDAKRRYDNFDGHDKMTNKANRNILKKRVIAKLRRK